MNTAIEKVLVLNATGKAGGNVCRALIESGFDVYGTTRANKKSLADKGIKPVLCNYTVTVSYTHLTLPTIYSV